MLTWTPTHRYLYLKPLWMVETHADPYILLIRLFVLTLGQSLDAKQAEYTVKNISVTLQDLGIMMSLAITDKSQ